ncbi:MAG: phosphatidate cytidylyltransferase [Gammaproteobacteria bacterium]|nr:phosphatidate cytidylyltransferase [Gammaproteobacteria bacterium]NND39467.1 phosphatidate cytidylyltransferase [Pseudomonadales bacterium]NNL10438.1 phosphatidate cytidylyltransferase [Pseudomonadales bacterium]NNM11917.1 phosphatidate cytidylyltransferase [Pseudomonadales bacterium]
MLRLRIATGVAAAAGFLGAVALLPARHLSLISTVVLCFAAWEMAALSGARGRLARFAYAASVALLAVAMWLWLLNSPEPVHASLFIWFGAAALLWLLLLGLVLRYPRDARHLQNPLQRAVLGFAVLAFAGTGFSYLSVVPLGKFWLVYVVAVVVVADVGAYFVGKAFGKHKLAPAVSPGKSWEGFWGGFITAQLLAAVFYFWVLDIFQRLGSPPVLPSQLPNQLAEPAVEITQHGVDQLSLPLFTLTAAVLSSTSVLGDLFESVLKRNAGVKDSGSILPGHGGVLDRIDGLLPCVPLLALFVVILNW